MPGPPDRLSPVMPHRIGRPGCTMRACGATRRVSSRVGLCPSRDPSRGCAIGLWACRFGRQTAARQAAAAGSGACRWGRWPTIRRRRRWLYRTETSLRAGMMTSRSARRKLSPSPRQQTSAPPFGHKVHSHRIATRRTEPRHVPAAELGSASQVEKRSSARRVTLASRTPSLSTCVMCASGWAPTPGAVVGATTTSARAATRPRVGWSTSRCVQPAPGYSADLLTTLTPHSGARPVVDLSNNSLCVTVHAAAATAGAIGTLGRRERRRRPLQRIHSWDGKAGHQPLW
jgi:hypothetical protein